LNNSLSCAGGSMPSGSTFDVADKMARLAELDELSASPDFWDNPSEAQKIIREASRLREEVERWRGLSARLSDALELAELGDESLYPDLLAEFEALKPEIDRLEFVTLFSGEYDREDAILAIHAGTGGIDAMDWAAMLQRMYVRWAEGRGFEVDIFDLSEGDEAGIKSVTMSISGSWAYGYLRAERGVHRLVRLSPFDAAHRRHTSFALVEVWPDVHGDVDVEIDPNDLEIETFRSSGAGGQHVQKNETAVRITHIPTGIVVSCQNERSQTQNREVALRVLRARLLELERRRQQEEQAELKGAYVDANFGNQIRSYVLHPYQKVKDHRTDYENANANSVLNGNLDDFMEAYLRYSSLEG
jgi:peptide chain release factor 2